MEDWANTGHSDDDLDNFYAHKQQEKERRKKKRKKNKDMDRRHIDWDDTYDPERPNVYDDYKDGEEKFREIEDWKNKLYGRVKDSESEGEEDARPVLGGGLSTISHSGLHSLTIPRRARICSTGKLCTPLEFCPTSNLRIWICFTTNQTITVAITLQTPATRCRSTR